MNIKNKHFIHIASAIFSTSLIITGCSSTEEKESVNRSVPLSGTDEQVFVLSLIHI